MEASIINYRRGRRTMRGNQMILETKGSDSRAKAAALIGKKVVWKSTAGKEIHGKIVGAHGNSGALRARFNRGMPGQAIGGKVKFVESNGKPAKPKKPVKPKTVEEKKE